MAEETEDVVVDMLLVAQGSTAGKLGTAAGSASASGAKAGESGVQQQQQRPQGLKTVGSAEGIVFGEAEEVLDLPKYMIQGNAASRMVQSLGATAGGGGALALDEDDIDSTVGFKRKTGGDGSTVAKKKQFRRK